MSAIGAVVPEGGRVVIDGSKLDASNLLQEIPESHRKSHHIQYRLVSLPQYGSLSVRAKSLSRCLIQDGHICKCHLKS